ncbi:MAG: DeoR/GlpR transcriptional regulator [Clostridia bacterium]|nr:DeoR/GlpR transcriptional regulator [Clostridia bacterium]
MFASERQELICKILQKKGAVTVSELTKAFSISIETARRDLLFLEDKKLLQRVHGGAISTGRMSQNQDYSARIDENKALKHELCEYAADLINEGDIIALDSGTTAIELAEIIKIRFKNLTVVTHDPNIFHILSENETLKLILAGGHFCKEENAFYGPIATSVYENLHVSKAFVFASAISLKFGVSGFSEIMTPVQKTILDISDKVIVCADSDKFEKTALIKLCDLNENHTYITDSNLSDSIFELYAENNLNIVKGPFAK